MKKIIDNYLKTQKEHLNSFDNIFYTNNELSHVSESIANSFNISKTKIDDLINKLEIIETSYNLAELELLNERVVNSQSVESTYKELFASVNKKNHQEKIDLNNSFNDLMKKTDLYIKKMESDKLKQLNDTRNRYNLSILKLKQENKLVDESINNEKIKYLNKTKKLTLQLENKLNEFEKEYYLHISSFESLESKIIEKTNILIEDTENDYSQFSENHKQNILKNKQNFYNTTELINDKINDINKNYKILTDEIQLNHKNKIEKLNFENEEFLKNLQTETRSILDTFESQLVQIDNKIDELKKDFEERENILNAIYNKDITSINVLFQREKNEYNKQLSNLINEFEEKVEKNITISSSYEKSFLKYKKQIENSLRILENITQSKILKRKKIFFKEKYLLNKHFIRRQALYRSLRFVKDEKKNASLNYEKRKHNIFDNYYNTTLYYLNSSYNNNKEIIESKQALEISPLDSQLSNARLLHFNESGLLSLEQAYKRDSFLNSKSTILYQSHLELLSLKLESTVLKSNYKFEVDNLKRNNYLEIQYQKNVYDGIVKAETITKQINTSVNELKSLRRKHKDDLYVIEHNSKTEKETAKLNVDIEKRNVQENLLKEKLIYETEKLKLNKQKDINAYRALENIKNCSLENDHQQNIVKIYFQMLKNFKKERMLFIEMINKIASTDDFILSKSLPVFNKLLTDQNQISKAILDDLLIKLTNQTQEKIDAHKLTEYDQKYKQIIDEFENTKIKTEKEIKIINEEIKNIRNHSFLIYQLIEKIKEENKEKQTTKLVILDQIKGLKREADAQSKKTVKQLRLQINALNDEINANKLIILKSHKSIKEQNQTLNSLNAKLKPLSASFKNIDNFKEDKIKALNLQHNKDTLPLIKTIENLTETIAKFKEINDSLLLEYENIISLPQSSNNIIEKQISYIFNSIDENFNNTHTSLSLLIEHLYTYNKKEQLKIEQEFTNNFQLSLNNLAKKHDQIVKSSNTQLSDLTSYLTALFKAADKNLIKSLKIANNLQKTELKRAAKYIRSLRDYKKKITENNKNLLTAFSENQNEVIKLNKRIHLQSIKDIKKDINLELKQVQEELKKNVLEANLKDQTYQSRIKTSAKQHLRAKANLITKLKKRNENYQRVIVINNDSIKKISVNLEKTSNRRDLKIKSSRRFLIKYQTRKIRKIKRTLNKNICKSTKIYKKSLKKSL